MKVADIALRRAERGLIVGASESGKSTLADSALIPWFVSAYPTGRVFIADTKPRFRAEWDLSGIKAKHRYRTWDHGPVIPGSVRLDLGARGYGLDDAWQLGYRVAIAQTEHQAEFPAVLAAMDLFLRQSRASRPQLNYVDEVMDFFSRNGMPIRGGDDSVLRSARTYRERGVATLVSTQRPAGIPIQLMSEFSKLYLGRLENIDDLNHLADKMGLPDDAYNAAPRVDREFLFYRRRMRDWRLVKLTGVR